MSNEARNQYIRTSALNVLDAAKSSIGIICDVANAVPHGRQRPTAPAVIRRELARTVRRVEEARARIEAVVP